MKKIVILAAGKGKRMNSNLPKVLVSLKDRPMIGYLIQSIIESGLDKKPTLVVSPDNIKIFKKILVDYDCVYAIQEKQLGTGHALACAKSDLAGADKVISFYGDHPFIKAETIKRLADNCNGTITMMTTVVENFNSWEHNFFQWGRIVRKNGEIAAIVEFKDADDEIKQVKEVNPGFYCFDASWLWENITKLKNNNAQEEYYITDLVKMAFEQGHKINSIVIKSREAMGINNKDELALAENLI